MDITWENAEKIWKEVLHEKGGVWYISDEYGFKILIKSPSSAIRSIIKGCKVEFIFGKDNENEKAIFHTGVKIFDDAIHFLNLSGTHRFEREHNSLLRIMKNELIPVQLFNEMSVCVAFCVVSFDPVKRMKVIRFLGDKSDLYTGDFDEKISRSLDCFAYTIDKSLKFDNVHDIEVMSMSGSFSEWKMMENHFAGVNEASKIVIDDLDEGGVLEKQVWTALESLFDYDIYLHPQVSHKNVKRELTDILAFSEYGIFLIETKALGILNNEKDQNIDRKVANIQKQVEKGIKQLAGAVKKIRSSEIMFDNRGNEIKFDRTLLPHCIVLVSDLLSFGDWTPTVMKMFQTMIDVPMQLHLMDLTEFMRYIGYSMKSKYQFDYLLMKRTEELVKHQSVHINLHVQAGSSNDEKK
jgi:hypothetical protein